MPRRISTLYYVFLRRDGAVSCVVTGTRRYSYDLPQGGMEIPCQLKFTSDDSKSLQKIFLKLLVENLRERDHAKAPLHTSEPSCKVSADLGSSTSSSSSLVSVQTTLNLHADGDTEIWVRYDHRRLNLNDRIIEGVSGGKRE